jgi:hypothetical protein
MLKAGADVNAPPTKAGEPNALQITAENRSIEVVQILLKARADVNAPPTEASRPNAL